MWDLPGPGLEPVSPALAGGFLTTEPPGKSLETMDVLTILILPVCECGISFHLLVSTLNFFINVLLFSEYRSFTSLVKFIPRYFIVFDVTVSGIFLLSLSDNSLLAYRNATDFCILILHAATLLNSFISSNSFLMEYLGFPI